MQHQLSCEQVTALLTFYAEDKLSKKHAQYVQEHLKNCPECMEKFNHLKQILNKYRKIQNDEPKPNYNSKQYEDFKINLSAYIDNELNDFENIKIKKFAIANPLARQDLENIYTYKKLLHSSFERTKNELKTDYSKSITHQIQQECMTDDGIDPFLKLSAVFFVMVSCIVFGLIKFLYF